MDQTSDKEKKPKKRGRKPKNKTVEAPKNKLELSNNLIIRLNNIENKGISDVKPYNNEDENLSINAENNCVSKVCWNCCHDFNSIVYGVPLKYHREIFYIYGYFCSLECGARYVFDNLKNHDFNEILSLINLFNNNIHQKSEPIVLPPNRLILSHFGGNQSIEEYRNNNQNNIHDIIIPPILPLNHKITTYEINSNTNKKSNLKLYRKTELDSNKKNMTDFIKYS